MPQSLAKSLIHPMGSNTMFGPFRARIIIFSETQGVALGWNVEPLSGQRSLDLDPAGGMFPGSCPGLAYRCPVGAKSKRRGPKRRELEFRWRSPRSRVGYGIGPRAPRWVRLSRPASLIKDTVDDFLRRSRQAR